MLISITTRYSMGRRARELGRALGLQHRHNKDAPFPSRAEVVARLEAAGLGEIVSLDPAKDADLTGYDAFTGGYGEGRWVGAIGKGEYE